MLQFQFWGNVIIYCKKRMVVALDLGIQVKVSLVNEERHTIIDCGQLCQLGQLQCSLQKSLVAKAVIARGGINNSGNLGDQGLFFFFLHRNP